MDRNMKKSVRMATATLGLFAICAVFTPDASAGCGNGPGSIGAFNAKLLSATQARESPPLISKSEDTTQPGGSDIVGMWTVKLVAMNNPAGPPDGTPVDEGFSQWHSDGTEIMNSARAPATGNFCLGVWKKTGRFTYKLNHQLLNFDPSGVLIGPGTIREEVVLDRGGNSFSGTFTIDLFDTSGNTIVHVVGRITGARFTVD